MRKFLISALLAGMAVVPTTAFAQSSVDGRVDRLEREMKAVQRKVFPGGSGQYFEPQITAPQGNGDAPGTPATSPVIDLAARVNALESQMATLTGNSEQALYRLRTLEDAFNAYKRSTDARLKALEDGAMATARPAAGAGFGAGGGGGAGSGSGSGDDGPAPGASSAPVRPTANGVSRPAPATKPAPSAASGKNDPDRAAKIAAIEKPSSGDAGEDAYFFGYRLWQAKLYPEAEAALKDVVTTYPKHRRASYAQNLLGRSYLDEGRPSLASIAFYDNYKKMPDGERAPDSLYYLAQALMKLNKPADACKVYVELGDVYAAKISETMKADIARGRTAAKCQ
jgi:TolA-binding protein